MKEAGTPTMKAILFSLGTRGDIEPFLAIAQLLKERDWQVICVFPEQFRELVENMELPFRGFNKEFLDMLDSKEAKMFMGGQGSIFKRVGYVIKMARNEIRLFKDMLALQYEIQKVECPDRILYGPKCYFNLIWGMVNPGKSILVSPIPGIVHPIKDLTFLGDFGKTVNKLINRLGNTGKSIILKKLSKRYYRDYPSLEMTVSSIKEVIMKEEKTFYTLSPSLFPKPNYWPSSAHVIGYYDRDQTLNWQPDAALTEFLKNHKKIIFITFGSMPNASPKEKTRIIVEVLKRNSIPAIINTSLGGLQKTDEFSSNIHFVDSLPYDWIFPKMYAVIHHGGSGTTHMASKYTCPSLIIPHIMDQFYWNKVISNLHLGPKGVSIKNLNEKNFEKKVLDLIHNESYKRNAELISQKMKTESNKDKLYKLIAAQNAE